MKYEHTDEEKKVLIKEKRKDIAADVFAILGHGLLMSLMAVTMVAGSAMGIAGGTLFAVGKDRVEKTIDTYIASEAFQEEKAVQLAMQQNLPEFAKALEEVQKQGYLADEDYVKIKNKIASNLFETNDRELAFNLISKNENNEFHDSLKKDWAMRNAGIGLMAGSGFTFLIKGLSSLFIIQDFDYLCTGEVLADKISEFGSGIANALHWDIIDQKEINKMKKELKESKAKKKESPENEEEENEAE